MKRLINVCVLLLAFYETIHGQERKIILSPVSVYVDFENVFEQRSHTIKECVLYLKNI